MIAEAAEHAAEHAGQAVAHATGAAQHTEAAGHLSAVPGTAQAGKLEIVQKADSRPQALTEYRNEMIERTERAVRAEIASIPDGVYEGAAATDDDGTELDTPVWVRVKITIAGI